MHKGSLGSCCDDLNKALKSPPNSFFRVEENDVFYLTIGFVETSEGVGWFDQAIIYCPFCGSHLQDPDEIRQRTHGADAVH